MKCLDKWGKSSKRALRAYGHRSATRSTVVSPATLFHTEHTSSQCSLSPALLPEHQRTHEVSPAWTLCLFIHYFGFLRQGCIHSNSPALAPYVLGLQMCAGKCGLLF